MRTELSVTPQSQYPAQLLERMGTNLGTITPWRAPMSCAAAGSGWMSYCSTRARTADCRAVGDEADRDKLELAQNCAQRIRAHLGVRLVASPAHRYPLLEPAAMESYARGMERLRQSDALSAAIPGTAAAAAPSNFGIRAWRRRGPGCSAG